MKETKYKPPVLNWHFMIFGAIPLFFLNFMILRELGGGEFLSARELIHAFRQYSWDSSDFAEAFLGLFSTGLFLDFIISLIRFKGYRIAALGKQIQFLLIELAILVIFDLALSSVLKVVCVLTVGGLLISWLTSERTRRDAIWDLILEVREYEDKYTSDQKRAIEAQFMHAMLDESKSETDTEDIDAIRYRNRPRG